jgi:hypothetical protein
MDAEQHPDPFQDAFEHGLHRAVQVASCAVTAAQVYAYHQKTAARMAAERDERARRALNAQSGADRSAARAAWTPAQDPGWLRQADLLQTAQAWGAAMPYADRGVPWYEPTAATAMRKCEDRLRDLHPHAMARYDRLRSGGMNPAEAMREAAPLFARPTRVYDGPFSPRPMLNGGGADLTQAAEQPGPGIGQGAEPGTTAGLAVTLLSQAASAEGERAADLDAVTGLAAEPQPGERARELASAHAAAVTAEADTARAARTARPWKHDFPIPIQAVVAAAVSGPAAGRPAAAVSAPGRRPGRGDRNRS